MKTLIVCADDFGLSPGINEGIINCLETGFVRNAAVMIDQNYSDDIIPFIKNNHQYSFGLHLVIRKENTILRDFEEQLKLYERKIGKKPEHISLHCSNTILKEYGNKIKDKTIISIFVLAKKYNLNVRGTKSSKVLSYRACASINDTKKEFNKIIFNTSFGINEIIVHPGIKDDPYLNSSYPSPLRANELKILTKYILDKEINDLAIRYRDAQDIISSK